MTALDFGQIYNGPYCGFLLAQAGARVIKVESPLGEPLRARGEPSTASYPFALLNSGKQGITLNIKSEAGQAVLKRLAREVDVVLENFAPGTMDRYGIGAAALRRENPRLIYAAGTGYGATGPHRDYLGMDITIQAMSGIMSITGQEDTPPLKSGAALCDFFGGVHLYAAIVSALYRRQQNRRGRRDRHRHAGYGVPRTGHGAGCVLPQRQSGATPGQPTSGPQLGALQRLSGPRMAMWP